MKSSHQNFFFNWGLNKRSRNQWDKKIAINSGNLGTSTAAFSFPVLVQAVGSSSTTPQGAGVGLLGGSQGQTRSQQHILLAIPSGSICWCYHPGLRDTPSELLTFSKELISTSQKAALSSLVIPVAFHLQFSVESGLIKSSYLQRTSK